MREAIAAYQEQQNSANIDAVVRDFFLQFKPRPRLTVSEWADRYRHLPSESSPEPGQWKTDRTPYLKEPMNVVNQPDVHTAVYMFASQVGKSEILNNIMFYYSHQDPCAQLMIQPTLTDAEDYSKSRIAPSIRDSPVLKQVFGDEKKRNSSSTTLKKSYNGGRLVLVGANSPSGLSSKPVRIALGDEIDRYEATKEGSPVRLAEQRTVNYFNRKLVLASTPSTAGISEIEKWYKLSDQRKYFVPCSECEEFIILRWEEPDGQKNVVWDKGENGDHLPDTAHYCCPKCGSLINDYQINEMVKKGEWRATAPFNGIAGFGEFCAIYSPWQTMAQIVKKFLECKDDSDDLKTFVNLKLGQCWEEKSEKINSNDLYLRREVYNLVVPRQACYITCAADIQKDRIEALTVAWGMDEEAWIMEHWIGYGDTSAITHNLSKTDVNQLAFGQISDFDTADKVEGVWKKYDDFRKTTYDHEAGELIRIDKTTMDSSYETEQVYNFVKSREREGVYAIKGDDGVGKPAVNRPSTKNKGKIHLYTVGTFTVKDSMKARLNKSTPGPGYIHLPDRVDLEFCEQLGAEKKIFKKYHGQNKIEWTKIRARNEAWDLLCYNFAALRIKFSTRDDLNKYVVKFQSRITEKQQNIKSTPSYQRRILSKGIE